MNEGIKLKVSNIEKSFPGVKALDKINFSVRKGTVHVLCGENGAGKSTLMKIINGIYKADAGEILIDGKIVEIQNPIQARSLGISMIFQELNYMPEMTIEESLFVGNWPTNKYGNVNWHEIRKRTIELLKKENLDYSPEMKLKDLTVSDIQMLEILKAISYNSDIIIMDEPTSAITQKEVEVLFKKINELRDRGASIIYISHKMDEIFRIAEVFIEKEHRGNGIGRKIFDKLPKLLYNKVNKHISCIYLMPGPLEKIDGEVKYIMNSNDEQMIVLKEKLIKFYESVGFERIGNTDFYHKNQVI